MIAQRAAELGLDLAVKIVEIRTLGDADPTSLTELGGIGAFAAALREAREETGLLPGQVSVLGTLPTMATGTGFWVTPVVGLLDAAVRLDGLTLSPDEVQEAFLVPLAFLMNPARHQRRIGRWQQQGQTVQRSFLAMPWRAPDGRSYFIWGATATILRNFYHFLAAD